MSYFGMRNQWSDAERLMHEAMMLQQQQMMGPGPYYTQSRFMQPTALQRTMDHLFDSAERAFESLLHDRNTTTTIVIQGTFPAHAPPQFYPAVAPPFPYPPTYSRPLLPQPPPPVRTHAPLSSDRDNPFQITELEVTIDLPYHRHHASGQESQAQAQATPRPETGFQSGPPPGNVPIWLQNDSLNSSECSSSSSESEAETDELESAIPPQLTASLQLPEGATPNLHIRTRPEHTVVADAGIIDPTPRHSLSGYNPGPDTPGSVPSSRSRWQLPPTSDPLAPPSWLQGTDSSRVDNQNGNDLSSKLEPFTGNSALQEPGTAYKDGTSLPEPFGSAVSSAKREDSCETPPVWLQPEKPVDRPLSHESNMSLSSNDTDPGSTTTGQNLDLDLDTGSVAVSPLAVPRNSSNLGPSTFPSPPPSSLNSSLTGPYKGSLPATANLAIAAAAKLVLEHSSSDDEDNEIQSVPPFGQRRMSTATTVSNLAVVPASTVKPGAVISPYGQNPPPSTAAAQQTTRPDTAPASAPTQDSIAAPPGPAIKSQPALASRSLPRGRGPEADVVATLHKPAASAGKPPQPPKLVRASVERYTGQQASNPAARPPGGARPPRPVHQGPIHVQSPSSAAEGNSSAQNTGSTSSSSFMAPVPGSRVSMSGEAKLLAEDARRTARPQGTSPASAASLSPTTSAPSLSTPPRTSSTDASRLNTATPSRLGTTNTGEGGLRVENTVPGRPVSQAPTASSTSAGSILDSMRPVTTASPAPAFTSNPRTQFTLLGTSTPPAPEASSALKPQRAAPLALSSPLSSLPFTVSPAAPATAPPPASKPSTNMPANPTLDDMQRYLSRIPDPVPGRTHLGRSDSREEFSYAMRLPGQNSGDDTVDVLKREVQHGRRAQAPGSYF